MSYFVYLIQSVGTKKNKTYVGYTNNLKRRISLHNDSKGAKATRGFKWKLLYQKKFYNKSEAMSYEYKIKKKQIVKKKKLSIYPKNFNQYF